MRGATMAAPPPLRSPDNARARLEVPPAARARRWRRLTRYSRMVQVLKVLLPVIALLLLILIALWPHIRPQDDRFRIGIASLGDRDAGQLGMVNPRYLGTDDIGRPYTVSADLARSDTPDAARVELEMPKADIVLEDGSWLVVTANNGLYVQESRTLDLAGSVNLFHDSGYEFRTASVDVDLADNVAVGRQPVEGQGPFGNLAAEGFEIRDRGRTILLTGKARLMIYPETPEASR